MSVAREALKAEYLGGTPYTPPADLKRLFEPAGAFVTLRSAAVLRGCIGSIFPVLPLFQTVAHCAVSAALSDPRFPAVRAEELRVLEIEISILSELEDLPELQALEIGKHGLYIESRERQGILLPQVALEHRLDALSFLRAACRKAGLGEEAWQGEARVQIFTAEIFSGLLF